LLRLRTHAYVRTLRYSLPFDAFTRTFRLPPLPFSYISVVRRMKVTVTVAAPPYRTRIRPTRYHAFAYAVHTGPPSHVLVRCGYHSYGVLAVALPHVRYRRSLHTHTFHSQHTPPTLVLHLIYITADLPDAYLCHWVTHARLLHLPTRYVGFIPFR